MLGLNMLQDLHIKGFKGFKDLQVTDISRVMLVGGENNIGKTSLLEGIFLFYNTADPRIFFQHLGWRGLDISFRDMEALYAPIFMDFNMDNSISFEVKDGLHIAKMTISSKPSQMQKAVSMGIPTNGNALAHLERDVITANSAYDMNIHYEVSGVGQEDVAIVLRQIPNNLSMQFEPHPVTIIPSEMQHNVIYFPSSTKTDPSEDIKRINILEANKNLGLVIDFLQVIEPKLIGLTAVMSSSKPAVYADIQGLDRKIPMALLGDGINKLLSIILAIATADNGIILIDEVDIGIHWSVLSKVWGEFFKMARDFNCQIIATTQNYE